MPAEIVNRITGEARLDGERGSYGVVFDLAAVAALEQQQAGGTGSILQLVAQPPGAVLLAQMITVGTAGYSRRHPGAQKPLNPSLALKVIEDCGGLIQVGAVVRESVARAHGLGLIDDDDLEEADAGADAVPPPGPGAAL